MTIQPDAIRNKLVLSAIRLLPAGVLARLLVAQPQAAGAMRLLVSIRGTGIARALADISQADIQQVIEAIEGEPAAAAWRDVLAWARRNPRKTQQIIRNIMTLAGVPR